MLSRTKASKHESKLINAIIIIAIIGTFNVGLGEKQGFCTTFQVNYGKIKNIESASKKYEHI